MVKNLTLVSLFLVLSAFFFQEDAREYFKFAKFNFDSGNYEKALGFINKALKEDPAYINGYILRAEINFKLHKYSDVIDDATMVIDGNMNETSLLAAPYLLRGEAYFYLDRLNEALADVEQSLRLDPGNAPAHFVQGNIYYRNGMLYDALESFDHAIQIDPDNQEYYYLRAKVKMEHYRPIPGTKTYDNIMADIKVAMALKPNDHRPYELKCRMLKLNLERDKEIYLSELTEAIELFPDQPEFYAQRGMVKVLDYDFSSALDDFTMAVRLDPENEVNYRNRGLCWHNVGKYSHAIDDYTQAIDIMIRKYKQEQSKSMKKLLAETLVMRGRTYSMMRNSNDACNDYYNAAKLGSKTGLNNYRKNCNVFE